MGGIPINVRISQGHLTKHLFHNMVLKGKAAAGRLGEEWQFTPGSKQTVRAPLVTYYIEK